MLDNFNETDVTSDEVVPSTPLWSDTVSYKIPVVSSKPNPPYVSRFSPTDPRTERVYVALTESKGSDPLTSPAQWKLEWVEPSNINLDPRLDHTVGRRGLPYLDWGIHPGRAWIRKIDYGGPYAPKKNVF